MAPAPEEKMEAMLICLTAMNMDLKTVFVTPAPL
jgi:hypothetical protein